VSDVDAWWQGLRTTALVGTARRDVDPMPMIGLGEAEGSRERRLLVAAAIADVVRRAGRLPATGTEQADPAPAEEETPADERAQQLLNLVLVQPPVSAQHRLDLVETWLRSAVTSKQVVPPALLPAVLDALTPAESLHALARQAVGHRGRWLAKLNPAWTWAVTPAPAPGATQDLEHLSPTQRARELANLRTADPGAARAAVLATWATDSAQVRAANLETLTIALSEDDAAFLDSCLDDRAKSVRELAQRLLDGLPRSERAARQARRLEPLLRVGGTLRRTLEVDLPDDPDAAGVRDGLVDPGARRSRRAFWLRRLVEGAPLGVWTGATGADAARTLSMLRGEHADDVREALRSAARRQHDAGWARALLGEEFDASLLDVLPRAERSPIVLAHLRRTPLVEAAPGLLRLDRPWEPAVSEAVVSSLRRGKDAGHVVRVLRDVLVPGLDASVLPAVESWLRSLQPDADRVLRATLRDVLQFQSLSTSIRESF
jgi:hypothetical protein